MSEKKEIKIDKIIKSKRKTVMMQITKDAQLVVRAPKYTPNFVIKIAVQKRAEWVQKNQKKIREKVGKIKKKQFIDDEKFLYLGQVYKLVCLPKDNRDYQGPTLIIEDGKFFMLAGGIEPKKIFEDWYKKRAKETIVSRVEELAFKHKFSYNKIRITCARTRWGSCSSKRNINISWRLIMAPERVTDYVILHELAHLKERNHRKQFWVLVERMCPKHKEHRKWLKENGQRLDV